MRNFVLIASRIPAATLTGLVLGAAFAYFSLWALRHSYGPIEMLAFVNTPEIVFATVFGLAVFVITFWRMVRGNTAGEEVDRAIEVLGTEDGD